MFRPPILFATQVVPTDPPQADGSRDVYIRASYGLLPLHTSDMLAVRIGQLTAGDFHPFRFAALSAAPPNPRDRASGPIRLGSHGCLSPKDNARMKEKMGPLARSDSVCGIADRG